MTEHGVQKSTKKTGNWVEIDVLPKREAGMMLHESVGTIGEPDGAKLDMCRDVGTGMVWHIRGPHFTAIVDIRGLLREAAVQVYARESAAAGVA